MNRLARYALLCGILMLPATASFTKPRSERPAVTFVRISPSEDRFRIATNWGYGEFQMVEVLPNVFELENAKAVEGATEVYLADYPAVWEGVVALSSKGDTEEHFLYVGGGHANVSKISRTITVDGVDRTAAPPGTISGSVIIQTQAFNLLMPKDNSVVVGSYRLKHTFTSKGVLVEKTLIPAIALEWYDLRTAMLPLGTVNQIQFGTGPVQAISNTGAKVEHNKGSKASVFIASDTRHPYALRMTLPSGGPNLAGSWSDCGADCAWWVDQKGGAKLYVNDIALAYSARQTATTRSSSTFYEIIKTKANYSLRHRSF